MERETRVELATFSLEGWRSTNWATPAYLFCGASGRTWTGTELLPQDFKSCASTDFATKAYINFINYIDNYTLLFYFCQQLFLFFFEDEL